jgi:hypothetical protein
VRRSKIFDLEGGKREREKRPPNLLGKRGPWQLKQQKQGG